MIQKIFKNYNYYYLINIKVLIPNNWRNILHFLFISIILIMNVSSISYLNFILWGTNYKKLQLKKKDLFNSLKANQILINKKIHFPYLKVAVCIAIMKQIIRRLSKIADHMHQMFSIHRHRMFQINFVHQYLNRWQRPKRLEVCSVHQVAWALENNNVHFVFQENSDGLSVIQASDWHILQRYQMKLEMTLFFGILLPKQNTNTFYIFFSMSQISKKCIFIAKLSLPF